MTSRSSATELASVTWWICPGGDSHRAAYDSVRAEESQSASAAESMSRAGEGQGRVDYGEPIFSEAFPAALRLRRHGVRLSSFISRVVDGGDLAAAAAEEPGHHPGKLQGIGGAASYLHGLASRRCRP